MNNPDAQSAQLRQARIAYSRTERIGLGSLGVFLLALLVIAAWLEPDPAGLGTHKKLGLPGCAMHTLIGIRCPGCGMTTAWAHAVKGNVTRAIESNAGGVLLCMMSLAVFPCLIWLAIRGRPFTNRWLSSIVIAALIGSVGISFFEWMIRLALG